MREGQAAGVALEVFQAMQRQGVVLNCITYSTLIRACEKGKQQLKHWMRSKRGRRSRLGSRGFSATRNPATRAPGNCAAQGADMPHAPLLRSPLLRKGPAPQAHSHGGRPPWQGQGLIVPPPPHLTSPWGASTGSGGSPMPACDSASSIEQVSSAPKGSFCRKRTASPRPSRMSAIHLLGACRAMFSYIARSCHNGGMSAAVAECVLSQNAFELRSF